MQKRENHQTHSNIVFYHTRFAPINIFNLVISPDYVKTHTHTPYKDWFHEFSIDLNEEQDKVDLSVWFHQSRTAHYVI